MPGIREIKGERESIYETIMAIPGIKKEENRILVVSGAEIKKAVSEFASSLFIEKGIVMVILDPEKDILKLLAEPLKALAEEMDVIIYSTPVSKATKYKSGWSVTSEKEKEERIKKRVIETLKLHGKAMTDKAFRLFKEKVRSELMVDSELMKLINYVGDRREIRSGDVIDIVTADYETDIFALFDAIIRNDKKEGLAILQAIISKGLSLLAIHGFFVRQVRFMLQAKDMEMLFKAQMDFPGFTKVFKRWKDGLSLRPAETRQYLPFQKPYPAFKLSKAAERLTTDELLSLYKRLIEFEVNFKSGTREDQASLEMALLRI